MNHPPLPVNDTSADSAGLAPGSGTVASSSIREQLGLFAPILQNLTDAVCILDKQLRVQYWNLGAEKLSGMEAKEVVGKKWTGNMLQNTKVVLDQADRRSSIIVECLEQKETIEERCYLRRRDGRWVPIDSRAVPILDRSQRILAVVGIFRDISTELTLKSENDSLRQQSLTDPLTKTANRAAFDSLIKQQIACREESGQVCSLIMADLDHFKSINDTYGHTTGDNVLRVFANVMRQCCRPEDVIARYGGEEFGIVLPNCDTETAFERAESIRQQIESVAWNEFPDRQVTASFGVAELEDNDTELSIVGRADEALYQSKNQGRNRTHTARGLARHPDSRSDPSLEYVCTWLVTPSGEMIALKLKGFLKEHAGKMLDVSESRITVRLGKQNMLSSLRKAPPPMQVEITLGRTHISSQTHIRIVLTALNRKTTATDFDQYCKHVLKSLRSYLMADDADVAG